QFERERMPHLEGRRVVELARLALNRFDDLAPSVPGVHAPKPGAAVENLPPVVAPVVHALGRGEQARWRLKCRLAVNGIQNGSSVLTAARVVVSCLSMARLRARLTKVNTATSMPRASPD